MFGYLDIEKEKLEDGQRGLWQTFMCGLCFSTKNLFGNTPRMFISNDVNFFNVLFHSIMGLDVEIENKRCFSHPLKKRTVLKTEELTDRLAAANVLLTYWKLYDDVTDEKSAKKKLALKSFSKHYVKAKNAFPELDASLSRNYEELRSFEKSGCDSIDKVAHSFAKLSQDFCAHILREKTDVYAETLCYNLGKWIYLIDALDDAEKDLKKDNYNVFLRCYAVKDVKKLSEHKEEIRFLTYSTLNRIAQSYNDLNLEKYTCILNNVLYDSIRDKTKQVLSKIEGSGV